MNITDKAIDYFLIEYLQLHGSKISQIPDKNGKIRKKAQCVNACVYYIGEILKKYKEDEIFVTSLILSINNSTLRDFIFNYAQKETSIIPWTFNKHSKKIDEYYDKYITKIVSPMIKKNISIKRQSDIILEKTSFFSKEKYDYSKAIHYIYFLKQKLNKFNCSENLNYIEDLYFNNSIDKKISAFNKENVTNSIQIRKLSKFENIKNKMFGGGSGSRIKTSVYL